MAARGRGAREPWVRPRRAQPRPCLASVPGLRPSRARRRHGL